MQTQTIQSRPGASVPRRWLWFLPFESTPQRNAKVQAWSWHTTWLKVNIQPSSQWESQACHFLGQVYPGGTSSFWGLECLESGWTAVLLKDIRKKNNTLFIFKLCMFVFLLVLLNNMLAKRRVSGLYLGVHAMVSHSRSEGFLSRTEGLCRRPGPSTVTGMSFWSSPGTLQRKE